MYAATQMKSFSAPHCGPEPRCADYFYSSGASSISGISLCPSKMLCCAACGLMISLAQIFSPSRSDFANVSNRTMEADVTDESKYCMRMKRKVSEGCERE